MVVASLNSSSCRSWCGPHKIQFPVGADPGCGTPQLAMSCTNSNTLLINLNNKLFTVDVIDYSKKTLVLRDPQMTDCNSHLYPSSSVGLKLDFGGLHGSEQDSVMMMLGQKNTILFLNCESSTALPASFANKELDCLSTTCLTFIAECHNHDILTSCCRVIEPTANGIDPSVTQGCRSYTSIYHPKEPIFDPKTWSYGIEMQWSLPSRLVDACKKCETKNGICGYDSKKKFKCMCHSSMGCKGCSSSHLCSKMESVLIIGFASAAGSIAAIACIICMLMRRSCQGRRQPWISSSKNRSRAAVASASEEEEEEGHLSTKKNRYGTNNSLSITDEQQISSSSSSFETADTMATTSTTNPTTVSLCHLAMFSYKELEQATGSFTALLAHGIHSVIYRGKFCNGRTVAVKKFSHFQHHEEMKLFRNEAMALLRLNHPSIVKMEGFCMEAGDPLLVYEDVCRGTLENHLLHGLPWQQRLKAACEVAEALEYMHFSASTYHRDVKLGNILMDRSMRAKVANFESSIAAAKMKSKVVEETVHLQKDMDDGDGAEDESDVFGFGVMLVELVYGKKADDMWRPERSEANQDISIDPKLQKKLHAEAMAKRQDVELLSPEQAMVVDLAFLCIASHSKDRPDMRQVSAQLQLISERFGSYGVEENHPAEAEEEKPIGAIDPSSSCCAMNPNPSC